MGFASNRNFLEARAAGKRLFSSFRRVTVGASAATAGRWYDLSMCSGTPRMNVYPGSILTATKLWYKSAGSIWHGPNVSPDTKHLLTTGIGSATSTVVPGTGILCDYLMFYPLVDMDSTDLQELDNPIPLPRYTDGVGVKAMLVTTSDLGATPSVLNISYTNQAGVSGRTLSVPVYLCSNATGSQIAHSGTTASNFGPFLPLADGDYGIRSVQSLQLSDATGGGWAALVLVFPLATIHVNNNACFFEKCFVRDSPSLPQITDEAFLNYIFFTGAAMASGAIIVGYHEFVWG